MVTNVTSLSGNGLRDWILQRLSALILAVYVFIVLGYFICKSPMTYDLWVHFFNCSVVRVSSLLFLLALVIHAWIGVWTITTDYLKCACIRVPVQLAFVIMLVTCLIWGVDIFWGM